MPEQASQTIYYPEVECEARSGDADWELVVGVKDEKGNQQFLSVSKGMVVKDEAKFYLAIGVVDVDSRKGRVLIELPQESDSGVSRLWVPLSSFRQRREP